MKITLNLENTSSKDVSVVVDALRASTTITIALNNFKEVIPAFSPEKAKKIAIEKGGVLAGERNGATLKNFDFGNSPVDIKDYNGKSKVLVLTTSNGTRIIENMESKVLIGSFINAKSVAKSCLELAENHVDIVMAGIKGHFAIEDFLASGEIIFWIEQYALRNNLNIKISEFGQSAILASRNKELIKNAILNSKSSKRLEKLGFRKDVELSIKTNISKNVAIYEDQVLKLYNPK
jgi:2-phosphosulfolactate phosphatase